KSRLLAHLYEEVVAAGLHPLAAGGDAVERSTPYFVWRALAGPLLGRQSAADRTLAEGPALLKEDPLLAPLLPLLSPLLGLELSENERTQNLTGEARASATQDLLVELCLRQCGPGRPLILLLDDVQYLDSA